MLISLWPPKIFKVLLLFATFTNISLITSVNGSCVHYENHYVCSDLSGLPEEARPRSINFNVYARTLSDLVEFKGIPVENAKNVNHLTVESSIKRIEKGAFNNFKNLTRLYVNYNSLRSLGSDIFGSLPELTYLELLNNSLRIVAPGAFSGLTKLDRLVLLNNQLTKIPLGVLNNLTVSQIKLGHNQISELEDSCFEGLPNLRQLFLDSNNIRQFESAHYFGKISSALEELDLSRNVLTEITSKSFEALPKLKKLRVGYNSIAAIFPGSFSKTVQLLSLGLNSNQLSTLSPNIFPEGGLQYLDRFYVNSNSLMFLTLNFLESLPSGLSWSFGDNPWICPCYDLLLTWAGELGLGAICDRERRLGTRPSCIIVGPNSTTCMFVYQKEQAKRFVYIRSSLGDVSNC